MKEATLNVTGAEFNSGLIERIKVLLNGDLKDFEFQIRIKAKGSREEIRRRIEEAAAEMERGENTVLFTAEEFDRLTK
ncbi:MAG: hypothetical protein IPJ82_05230 [Lewinellaceae bacterium]|nr:hypothetical protein [Lewinellaceae bacterium]